jgi:hypothetical protein
MEGEKAHTKFVVGGTYRREYRDSSTGNLMFHIEGILIGSRTLPNGRITGVIYNGLELESYVSPGDPTMDRWTLLTEPVSVEELTELRALREAVRSGRELAELELSGESVEPETSALEELQAVRKRGRVDASAARNH